MRKMEYELRGLNCADCAIKIEKEIARLDGIDSAQLVFATQKLKLQIDDAAAIDELGVTVKKIVGDLEPSVEVLTSNTHSYGEKAIDILRHFKRDLLKLAAGLLLFVCGLAFNLPASVELAFLMLAYIVTGVDILLHAARNIIKGRVFDENFLMSIATIGAIAVGQYPEAAAVMLFFKTGTLLQDLAVHNSRKSIKSLLELRPETANLKTENGIVPTDPALIKPGDIVVIRPGERVPLDSVVLEGNSLMDTSALTGESVPRAVKAGDSVLGGFININGLITAEAVKTLEESAVSRILDLVQNAAAKKAHMENFITKFAVYYTPAVVISALLTALIPPLVTGSMDFGVWIYRALIFLVISCPCALVVSIPLTFFAGIGKASAGGILVKGSSYLEALNSVEAVVFDKTGTLTKGVFQVISIESKDNEPEMLLKYAALAEAHSSHPIARSIIEAYGKQPDSAGITSYEEISGYGVKVMANGLLILAGNAKLMENEGIALESMPKNSGTVVHVAVDGKYRGFIIVSDIIKEDSYTAISDLRHLGINNIIMLTGDERSTAEAVAGELKLDAVYSGLLPHQKVEIMEKIKSDAKGRLVFVGDGINDAPVLAMADIGVSMGALGSEAAIEASDIVLMTDEPSKLAKAVKIARMTRVIAIQNIVFAIGVKLLILLLGTTGLATMWEAVFADVGVTLIAVFNALRIVKKKF